MALSPQDKEFYEEKLGLGNFGYLFGATLLIGAISWPLVFFVQDWFLGDISKWSLNVAFNLSVEGVLLGSVVSVIMYLFFKFLLEVGWLPKRR